MQYIETHVDIYRLYIGCDYKTGRLLFFVSVLGKPDHYFRDELYQESEMRPADLSQRLVELDFQVRVFLLHFLFLGFLRVETFPSSSY